MVVPAFEAVVKPISILGRPGERRDPVVERPADAHFPALDPGLRRDDFQTETRSSRRRVGIGPAVRQDAGAPRPAKKSTPQED